jgi:membrane-bound inhibitor of C-type lysozyme
MLNRSYTLFTAVLLSTVIFILAGCSGGGTSTSSNGMGAVTAKLVWGGDKSAGKSVANAPAGVATVRLAISGPAMTTVQQDFPAANNAGTLSAVPVGSGLTFTASGLDATGAVTYSASVNNVTVQGGQTTDVGLITMLATGGKFLVANSSVSTGAEFDGSNYLFGIEGVTTSGGTSHNIGAQMISAAGTPVGTPITTGRTGLGSDVVFDGTNYLLVWEDNLGITPTDGINQAMYGMFVSKSGVAGAPFVIAAQTIWYDGLKVVSYGGGSYLVTYTRLINPALGSASTNRYVAGRMVAPDGTMGSEFRISTGFGTGGTVAFDGTNFFVVWREATQDFEVRGRFVSPAGVLGSEISINASTDPSDNPIAVAFNGTNYLVIWNDEILANSTTSFFNWQVKGQLVSPAGGLVGSVIGIATDTTLDQMATSVACNPANGSCLAAWVDRTVSSNWDMYGRYVANDGTLPAVKFAINTDPTNQMGGVGGFSNGKYLALINSGVIMGSGGIVSAGSVSGLLILSP